MKLRGYLAVCIVCVGIVVSDLFQRFIVSPWIMIRPDRRIPALTRWIRLMAWLVTKPLVHLGGATIPVPRPIVPAGPGVLILMNHQSLFDIPLVVQTVDGGYPRIVTRARYSRFVPLISHMVRLYQYPVVDPTAKPREVREAVVSLGEQGRDSELPIALFPEGTRARNGELGRFKTAGLRALLSQRDWTVYVYVADGFWQVAKFKDFLKGISGIQGRIEHVGTLEWTDVDADPTQFIAEARTLMLDGLSRLRSGASAA